MRNEILSAASKANLFLSSEATDYLESAGYDMEFIQHLLSVVSKDKKIVTKQDLLDFIAGDKSLLSSEKVIPNKVRRNGDIKVLPNADITGNSTCEAKVEDFINYFRSRYTILSKIIMDKYSEFSHSVSISKAKKLDRDVCIIGMVSDINVSKNGHKILQIEDNATTCTAFINKDSPLMKDPTITDEVIGLKGKFVPSGLFIVDKIVRPSVPKSHMWEVSDSTSSVAFMSDIHVGSKEFLKSGWDNMMNWLKHNAERQGVNYLIIAGDVVDGIGAYPGQEEDLEELSIYKQYACLAE